MKVYALQNYSSLGTPTHSQACAELCKSMMHNEGSACVGFSWIGSGPYNNTCFPKSALTQPFGSFEEPGATRSSASGVYEVIRGGAFEQFVVATAGEGSQQPSPVGMYLAIDGMLRPFSAGGHQVLGSPLASYSYGDRYQMPLWSTSNPLGAEIPGRPT